MKTPLSKIFPIYSINKNGAIVGDNKGCVTYCFKMSLPIILSQDTADKKKNVEGLNDFIEMLGDEVVLHFQSFYFKELFNVAEERTKTDQEGDIKEYLNRSYNLHFNERLFYKGYFYLYISKYTTSNLLDPKFDEDAFLNRILNASQILKDSDIVLTKIDREDLVATNSPIMKYFNLNDLGLDTSKDISFENNSVFVGNKKMKIFGLLNEHQLPSRNIGYGYNVNDVPVDNMYEFSYNLNVPHITNMVIYVPSQNIFKERLDNQSKQLSNFNVKGANDTAISHISEFTQRMNDFSCKGVYYHFNVMCFNEDENLIDGRIMSAFSESKMKFKEISVERKDIFLGSIPSNATFLVNNLKFYFSKLLNIEACSFVNLEQLNDNIAYSHQVNCLRLCDRQYGIPLNVDLYDLPKQKGLIQNFNTLVLGNTGGGKSFFCNALYNNFYEQGAHIFIIDASYSYKLQTQLHGGVYLSFTDNNKITFNPFHIDWLNADDVTEDLFDHTVQQEIDDLDTLIDEETEIDLKSERVGLIAQKINMLSGVLITILTDNDKVVTRIEERIYRKLLFMYYKEKVVTKTSDECCFDDFYFFMKANVKEVLEANNIALSDFNYNNALMILEDFVSGQPYGYLLNSQDNQIKNLAKERFIVIDVQDIRQTPLLFNLISLLALDIFNEKVSTLPLNVNKILGLDEAWQAISSPNMATFIRTQIKIIRKYGGRTVFASQEVEDFIASDIIKNSIIKLSHVKIFTAMNDYKEDFSLIKSTLSITDSVENKIFSIGSFQKNAIKAREVCINWGSKAEVYSVELPTEFRAIYETDPEKVTPIYNNNNKYGMEYTIKDFAEKHR